MVDPHTKINLMMASEVGAAGGKEYIRRITTTADNYSICLYSDEMVDYITKRCTSTAIVISPIHVDVTYNLTNMYALITTLRAVDFEGEPLLIGPILLTKRLRNTDLSVLWGDLSAKLKLKMEQLTFITDGDERLIKSICDRFPTSRIFCCVLHLIDNVNRRLSSYSMPKRITTTVINHLKEQLTLPLSDFRERSTEIYTHWESLAKLQNCNKPMQLFKKYY